MALFFGEEIFNTYLSRLVYTYLAQVMRTGEDIMVIVLKVSMNSQPWPRSDFVSVFGMSKGLLGPRKRFSVPFRVNGFFQVFRPPRLFVVCIALNVIRCHAIVQQHALGEVAYFYRHTDRIMIKECGDRCDFAERFPPCWSRLTLDKET